MKRVKASEGVIFYRVLPKSMGIEAPGDEIELGLPFAEAIILIDKMLEDLHLEISGSTMVEEEKEYYLGCRKSFIEALAPVKLTQQWHLVRGGIGDGLISKLQSGDVALRRHVSEQMLSQADLKELRDAVGSALQNLSASTLPQELQAFVSMHLIRIRTALDEYEYRGTSGLRDAISGYLGSVAMAREQIVTHTTEPQKTSLANVLTAANSVFLLAHNTAVAWPHIQAGITIAIGWLGL